jgi:hypothetical protein
MRNKRGDVSAIVVTVLCLTLFGVIMGSIAISKTQISRDLEPAFYFGDSYARAESFEGSMQIILLQSFLNSYDKILSENKFSDKNVNSLFLDSVNSDFAEIVASYKGGQTKSQTTREEVIDFFKNNKYTILTTPEGVDISVYNWEDKYTVGDGQKNFSRVEYSTNLSGEVEFRKLELPSFDEINLGYESCRVSDTDIDSVASCLRMQFKEFDISVLENIENSVVSLVNNGVVASGTNDPSNINIGMVDGTIKSHKRVLKLDTKREYLIGSEMKKISFQLVYQ